MESNPPTHTRKLPPIPDGQNANANPNLSAFVASQPKMGQTLPLQQNNSRISLGGSQSMTSMQSMGSSESTLPNPNSTGTDEVLQNQTFRIIYNNKIFMVDPEKLENSSLKFKEIITPYLNDNHPLNEIYVIIPGHQFTLRNMSNFLKLCQKLPTDVVNDEMKEICEIAKLFKADEIYNTGLTFVQNNIDKDFNIPDNKYDGSDGKTYIYAEIEDNCIHHSEDNINHDESEKQENLEEKYKDMKSVIYYIRREPHGLKCPIYRFCDEEHVLFSAKQKNCDVFIAEGSGIHINKDKCKHVGHIQQMNAGDNIVRTKDGKFDIKYVESGKPGLLSLNVSFPFNGETVTWAPKEPKFDAVKNKYYLNFHGEYHHTPLKSNKNIVLQNSEGHTTFIVRKMDNHVYEVECLPVVDKLTVFTIALSDIVGQYVDPYDQIDLVDYDMKPDLIENNIGETI